MFSSLQPDDGWQWVGDHIRPRVRVPEDRHWPIGLSLSTEVGYQRRSFSEDTWDWEIRPIADKQPGRWYFAVNPAFGKSIHGLNAAEGWGFAPAAKISYDVTKVVTLGVEYYASLGPLSHFSNWDGQEHQIFQALDLNLSPKWEFNFGVGFGLTRSTDDLLVKLIIGRRFRARASCRRPPRRANSPEPHWLRAACRDRNGDNVPAVAQHRCEFL